MLLNAKNLVLKLNDTTMDYIKFGKGSENLILIPGLGESYTNPKGKALPLAYFFKAFAKNYTVYIFARKRPLPQIYSNREMAGDIAYAMDLLNIPKAHIYGISQGGMIAQHLAINYPQKLNKLIIALSLSRQNKVVQGAIKPWISMVQKGEFKTMLEDVAIKSYTPKGLKLRKPFVPLLAALTKPKSFDNFITQANACLSQNCYMDLCNVKAPTLVIGAQKDAILGVEGSIEIAEAIQGSQLYIYQNYGHGAYEEAKDFNTRVLNFLQGGLI